jgi:pimeloyl-ACP methyl ester carboxylesterase
MRRTVLVILLLVLSVPAVFTAWAMAREQSHARFVAPQSGQFVHAGDVNLFVQTAGNPQNPAVVLLHGMAAWSETWRQTIDVLAESGWYVVAIDMPPFGYSDRPADHSYWRASQVPRLHALFEELHLETPIVVAHSYGSRGALELAMKEPKSLRGLVLVDPALSSIYSDTGSSTTSAVNLAISVPPLRHVLVAMTMTNPLMSKYLLQSFMFKKDAATDTVIAVYQRPNVLKNSTRDFGYWMQGFLRGDDTGLSSDPENYKKIAIPVTIFWGREDVTTPLAQGEFLESIIPQSRLIVLDGVGHMPHIEDTDTFNALLLQALKDQ